MEIRFSITQRKVLSMKYQLTRVLIFRCMLIGIASFTFTGCSPSSEEETATKPLMKIAEPQREALDKAKEISQALEEEAKQHQQAIEQASE